MAASACDSGYPRLQPVVFGQRSRWTPDQSHRGAWWDDGRWLATPVAASFTQVVRRE